MQVIKSLLSNTHTFNPAANSRLSCCRYAKEELSLASIGKAHDYNSTHMELGVARTQLQHAQEQVEASNDVVRQPTLLPWPRTGRLVTVVWRDGYRSES